MRKQKKERTKAERFAKGANKGYTYFARIILYGISLYDFKTKKQEKNRKTERPPDLMHDISTNKN